MRSKFRVTPRAALTSIAIAITSLAFAPLTKAGSNAGQENWPQWRGPLGTGVAPAANPPLEWSETRNIKWKVKLPGHGASTPVIWGNKVFILAAVPTGKKVENQEASIQPLAFGQERPDGDRQRRPGGPGGPGRGGGGFRRSEKPTEFYQFVVLCVDRASGKTLWQKTAKEELPHEGHHLDHGYSSYSPVTDGEHLIAYFGSRGLYCYDLDGNLKWEKDLGRMQVKNGFGEGSSPALHGNTLVVNWDHEGEDFIAAFDKRTGRELWRQRREEDTTWSTPHIVVHDGKAQVITAATRKVRAYDLQTGELVWESPGLTANAIPTPVSADGIVYLTSGFRGSALYAIKLGGKGDLTGSDAILWSYNKGTPYVPSPLLYKDRFYCLSVNTGMLSAFDAKTGKVLIDMERIPEVANVYASPVGAADKIYVVARDGTTAVLKQGDRLEILAINKLDDRIDASPALVGKELFLRGDQHLYCIATN